MLQLKKITLSDPEWKLYLEISASYLKENWPQFFQNDLNITAKEYGKELEQRLGQGGRGLFLFKNNNTVVGGANVYVINENSSVLNIAEFFVSAQLRKKGYGTAFYKLVCNWGIENQCKSVSLEVDKDKHESNLFWKSLKLDVDTSQHRNLYTGTIYE